MKATGKSGGNAFKEAQVRRWMLSRKTIALLWGVVLTIALIGARVIWKNPCNDAYLTLTFDDGYIDTFTTAYPLMKERHLKATVFVMPSLVGATFEGQPLMTWGELKALERDGWEIASHSLTHAHLLQIPSEDSGREINESQRVLERQGHRARTFAIPHGEYNPGIIREASQYYDAIRTSDWGYTDLRTMNRFQLRSLWPTNRTTPEEMVAWLEPAAKKGTWTIITLHHVAVNKSREYTISPEDLNRFLDAVMETGMKVKTTHEVISLGCDR